MTIRITDKSHDVEFVRKVEEISGENFHKCMQCGTCTGACPMKEDMDLPPRKIVLLTQFGLREQVDDSKTVWMCASCHKCEALCPRGIDLPKVMEAVRQVMLRDNVDYVDIQDIPEDARLNAPQVAFVSCFRKHTP
ncbi:4Fe-4S dicluster domain-containing protein [Planctomycetota bacterium]